MGGLEVLRGSVPPDQEGQVIRVLRVVVRKLVEPLLELGGVVVVHRKIEQEQVLFELRGLEPWQYLRRPSHLAFVRPLSLTITRAFEEL